jgi:hypothetical protein
MAVDEATCERALKLRSSGLSYKAIGETIAISKESARVICLRGNKQTPTQIAKGFKSRLCATHVCPECHRLINRLPCLVCYLRELREDKQ